MRGVRGWWRGSDRREGKGSGQGPCVINMWAVLMKRRPGVELGEVDGGALL